MMPSASTMNTAAAGSSQVSSTLNAARSMPTLLCSSRSSTFEREHEPAAARDRVAGVAQDRERQVDLLGERE